MLRCWCYFLWISAFHQFEARFIITESCSTAKSFTVIPERCILECVQVLYDNKFCSFCQNGAAHSVVDLVEYNKALVDKRKLEWCTACENGQLQINSDHRELRRHIANFFNALEAISWCNDALKLNEFKDETELNRRKRYNPGIGGSHYRPQNQSTHSINYSIVGMIIAGIVLLCVFAFLCIRYAKCLDPQQSYEINS